MALIRKIVLGVLLAASAAVLVMAGLELWNYRQWASLPSGEPAVTPDARARDLDARMDLLTKRISDMELLVLILLGTSGLYAIVFVASSYVTANGFARQADRTVSHIKDEIGLAMGDLRQLQEETEARLREMVAAPVIAATSEPAPKQPEPSMVAAQIREIIARLTSQPYDFASEDNRMELIEDEHTAAIFELTTDSQAQAELARLYLVFGQIYAASDSARSRFYLERALQLAEPESRLASEIHYERACRFAAAQDFPHAMHELAAAFEHQTKMLDERLANDIDEGGRLYELASTAPFDKAVNDLLLNMSIGIG